MLKTVPAGRELARAQITANANFGTGAGADIAGLSITFVGGSRPVRIEALCPGISGTAASYHIMGIYDPANTRKAYSMAAVHAASFYQNCKAVYEFTPTPGVSYTFKVKCISSTGTGTFNCGADAPGEIRAVEC